MLVTTEEQRTIRSRSLRRNTFLVLLPLLALLAGAFLVAGRAFAGAPGGLTDAATGKGSGAIGQPAQPNQDSPMVCPPNYEIVQTENATAAPGTDLVAGSQCDDCVFNISLPFAYTLYDQSFTSVTGSSNGQLDFGSPSDSSFVISCLPDTHTNYAIFAYWYDLNMMVSRCATCGVFTSVSGSAPNRTFNIDYRTVTFAGNNPVNFTVRLHEGQQQFDVVYGTLSGTTGTVGVEQDPDAGNVLAQYQCPGSPGSLTEGSMLTFTLVVPPTCPTGTPTNTRLPTNTRGPTNTMGPTNTRVNTRTSTPTVTGTPPTAVPVPTCGAGSNYTVTQSTGAQIVAGTSLVPGSRCDDCQADVALPFTYNLYGTAYSTAKVSSNGNIQLNTNTNVFANACLPYAPLSTALMPYWDDLRTDAGAGDGIFTSVSGSAPNRIFNIEWKATTFVGGGQSANFEVRLYEGQDRFDFVYGTVINGGNSATVGVQRNTTQYTQFSCNTSSLSSGLQLAFEEAPCGPTARYLTGHVEWNGRPAQPDPLQALPVKLTLHPMDGGQDTDFQVPNTDESGFFTVSVDGLANGNYRWWVKGPQFLANAGNVVLAGADDTQVEMGSMRPGDANNDNVVNATDFILLKSSFARECGSVNFDNRTDFNGDCSVTVIDFALLRANFGSSGQ